MVVTAIVVELIVLAGHFVFGWGPTHRRLAATPPGLTMSPAGAPSAHSVLLGLAAAARHSARTAPATGRVAYVRLAGWTLADQAATGGGRAGRPLTHLTTAWRTADGAGRTVTVQRTRTGTRTISTTAPAGTRLPVLTGRAARLNRVLGIDRGASTTEAIGTFVRLSALAPVPPAAQAQILARLAGDAGLANAGNTRDRAGRIGVAISFTAPQNGTDVRDTLVLDPHDGALLEFDETLAGSPGRRDVAPGALLSYLVFLRSGDVTRIGDAP